MTTDSVMTADDAASPEALFIDGFNGLAEFVHNTAVEKGWWDESDEVKQLRDHIASVGNMVIQDSLTKALDIVADRNDAEMLCLVHSEISEGLEGLRHGNPPSEKIPEFSCAEEEYADAIIRMMDQCQKRGWDLAGAVVAKIGYNTGREYRHGGKSF